MTCLNEARATLLAHLLHQIRPDWGITAITKTLWNNRDQAGPDYAALAIAATTAARDPNTQTPARVFQIREHWPPDIKPRLPPLPSCEDHPGQDAPTCNSCAADILCGDRPETHRGKHYEPESETP